MKKETTIMMEDNHLVLARYSNKNGQVRRGRSRTRALPPEVEPEESAYTSERSRTKSISKKSVDEGEGEGEGEGQFIDIIRSLSESESEGPDDIFDMGERYDIGGSSNAKPRKSSKPPRQQVAEDRQDIAAYQCTGHQRLSEKRDSVDEEPPQGPFDQENYLNRLLDNFHFKEVLEGLQNGATREAANIRVQLEQTLHHKATESEEEPSSHESYLIQILDNLHIKEALEGLQTGSMNAMTVDLSTTDNTSRQQQQTTQETTSHHRHAEEAIQRRRSQEVSHHKIEVQELKVKLKHEMQKALDLASKVNIIERKHTCQQSERETQISSLKAKLAQQDRSFSGRLQTEMTKYKSLEEKMLRDINASQSDSHTILALKETVSSLQEEVSQLNVSRVSLEASLDASQAQLDDHKSSTKAKIRDLERRRTGTEQQLEAEKAKSKKLELDLVKANRMLDFDKRKITALELSESRGQILVDAERKRAEAITGLNQRMKTAMRKLNRKAMGQEDGGNRGEDMKELGKRDARITQIKKILSGKGIVDLGLLGSKAQPIEIVERQKSSRSRDAKSTGTSTSGTTAHDMKFSYTSSAYAGLRDTQPSTNTATNFVWHS